MKDTAATVTSVEIRHAALIHLCTFRALRAITSSIVGTHRPTEALATAAENNESDSNYAVEMQAYRRTVSS